MRGPIAPRPRCLPPQLEHRQRGSAHAPALPVPLPSWSRSCLCLEARRRHWVAARCGPDGKSREVGKQWTAVHKAGSFCPSGPGQGDADTSLFRMLWNVGDGLSRN